MDEFKWIWGYVKRYGHLMLAGMVLVAAVVFLGMVSPYIQGKIVDEVIGKGLNNLLLPLVAAIVGATLIRAALRYSYQSIFEYVSQKVIYNIREQIYKRMQELDFEFFDRTKTGDIMSRMTGDLEAVRHFVAGVVYMTFFYLLTFVTVMAILFSINASFTLILLSVAPLIGYFTFKLGRVVKPAFSAIREQFSRLNSVVQENISGNRVVKAFTREDYEIEKFSKENADFRERNLDAAKIWEKYLPVLDSLAGMLSVIIILVGGIMVIRGVISLGQLVTFNGYVWALNAPMRMAGWLVNDVQRFAASAEKIMLLLRREPRIENPENPVKKDKLIGLVEFRDVSFSYSGGDVSFSHSGGKVLKNISFKAKPGQTVAIVGPTGSGKSTLVSLISRFYDCTSGEVLIDGINVKDLDLNTLRRNVSVAMQDIFLFSDTIEGNIAYGAPEAPMEDVAWAAGVAGAHDFITGLPEGYDTIVGERGVGLSGGQKQRVALARALLKDPSILILDDTTSSVDIETEHEIHKALKSFYKLKTTFIIAHRISSVKDADLILVLEDGKITERGTHEELIAKKGYYYNVFISQYGDFDRQCGEEVV